MKINNLRLVLLAVLGLVFIGILFELLRHASVGSGEASQMSSFGTAGKASLIAVLLAIVGATMWLTGGVRAVDAQSRVSAPATSSSTGEASSGAAAIPLTSLQVRGLGITVDELSQDEIWQHILAKADTHASIYSNVPADYPSSPTILSSNSRLRIGLALHAGAGEWVEYTPLPVFVFGPPKDAANPFGAAVSISRARQEGSLPFHLFLVQQAANDAGLSLDDVFHFFDANPEVPAALIFCTDGMVVRKLLGKPGAGQSANVPVVPKVFDSNVALLVTRPERVEQMHAFAVNEPDSVDTRETQYDLVKLWNFYWEETTSYDDQYVADEQARGVGDPVKPHTMSVAWWRSRLPSLWHQTENKGPGQFRPDVWTPVRWTTWQLKEFDDSPVLGYIHRPVRVRFTDDHGSALREQEQAAALQQGWKTVLSADGSTGHPARVFFDTTGARDWVIPLTQALGAQADAPSPGNVKEGFDIGYRLGNTGVSSALVQLGLSLMAGYGDGKSSVVVNRNPNGYAEFIAVTPPSDAEKKRYAAAKGDNPFEYKSND
ncbi:DUF2875 family protein [Paraburkholderia silviterrae]|uniref:DUF2875 domain-containing protein n=1 Tax=Paraburkholderia silviterrae TaxID=2528715 RepID=A0A4R5MDU6_9BURK|nr:DUF2875 family protein [Paraburkholderia silviterrae]TDG25219.1 DUF2875 domain-containing protein [Paraburkholderia silviterrae]